MKFFYRLLVSAISAVMLLLLRGILWCFSLLNRARFPQSTSAHIDALTTLFLVAQLPVALHHKGLPRRAAPPAQQERVRRHARTLSTGTATSTFDEVTPPATRAAPHKQPTTPEVHRGVALTESLELFRCAAEPSERVLLWLTLTPSRNARTDQQRFVHEMAAAHGLDVAELQMRAMTHSQDIDDVVNFVCRALDTLATMTDRPAATVLLGGSALSATVALITVLLRPHAAARCTALLLFDPFVGWASAARRSDETSAADVSNASFASSVGDSMGVTPTADAATPRAAKAPSFSTLINDVVLQMKRGLRHSMVQPRVAEAWFPAALAAATRGSVPIPALILADRDLPWTSDQVDFGAAANRAGADVNVVVWNSSSSLETLEDVVTAVDAWVRLQLGGGDADSIMLRSMDLASLLCTPHRGDPDVQAEHKFRSLCRDGRAPHGGDAGGEPVFDRAMRDLMELACGGGTPQRSGHHAYPDDSAEDDEADYGYGARPVIKHVQSVDSFTHMLGADDDE
jgi:hypothetical protein